MRLVTAAAVAVLLTATVSGTALAEEGMWTFDAFPTAAANAALGTHLDQAWLDRVRLASVRLSGCSASLVSAQGLILTNQHCVRACVQAHAVPGRDRLAEGVSVDAREEELTCPGQTAEVLLGIEDVTRRVMAAGEGKTGAAFVAARSAEQAAIEREACGDDPKLRCQVISLYRGGQFKLYRFHRYSDVRLVFTPEHQAVVFGGDPDNFNFPRFAMDSAFLRAYEDGRPAVTPAHLRWNAAAPRLDQPVFVSGNPGSTSRLKTAAQLATERDWTLTSQIKRLSELRGRLIRFADESDEHARMTRDAIRGTENNLKRAYGMQRALAVPGLLDQRARDEAAFRDRARTAAALTGTDDPFAEIAAVQPAQIALVDRYEALETQAGGGSALFGYARSLVRAAQERARASGERLPEYADSRLSQVEKSVTDPRNLEPELETLYLSFWLSKAREGLGTDAPESQRLLGRESPEGLGARLVADTRLGDPAVRRALWDGGLAAIQASDDPLIRFVLATDADARAVRQAWRARVDAPTDRAAERLATARFAVLGDSIYPDATSSPRLSYGRIRGWTQDGRETAGLTTTAGLWARATGAVPFNLAPKWQAAHDRMDPATIFTVATTNDIVGGNSGSPLLNADGEVIGAVFDGNLPSLGGAYFYDGGQNRTVAVSAQLVTEALTKIYGRTALVAELTADTPRRAVRRNRR